MMAPCLCGHPLHLRDVCACGCPVASPDYVAAAQLAGDPVTPELQALTRDMAAQLRWRRPGITQRACAYCGGRYYPTRAHAVTCSGACRVAMHRARKHESDADVPTPPLRHDCYARDRALATGRGLLTPREQYEADLRVRAMKRR